MADLKLLNEELEQNLARRDALRAKHKGDIIGDEAERTEFASLTERASRIVNEIEKAKQRDLDIETERQKAYLDDPVYKIPRVGNGEDADHKALHRAGWELKGGMWHLPTSMGKGYALYPEEVITGALPDDAVAAQYVNKVRRTLQPDYRDAWLKWYRNAPNGELAAMVALTGPEQKALSEGSETGGGFTVPPDIQAEIGGRRAQISVMRRLATVRSTVRDQWQQPMVAPNATAADRNIYSDDFVAAWVGETPSQASIDVTFDMFTIPIKKIRAYTLVSNDLIADSVGNLIADLSQRGGRSLALMEDKGFIQGAGIGLEPLGILNHSLARTAVASNGMAYDVEGTTADTISNTVADPGSAPKIKQLVYQLPSQYAENAVWMMRRTIQGKIAGLVDANGRPFWNSYLESGFGRPSLNIEGFPVVGSEFVGNDGAVSTTAATTPLIFGDISAYHIIERAQLSVRILTERFGDSDQTGLFLFSRVGGGLWNYDAIRTGYIAS